MRITGRQGQWLGDVAIREAGDITSLVEMAVKNGVSITEEITIGDQFMRPAPINRRVMNYYDLNGLFPATALRGSFGGLGGIGYMSVGITFIAS